VQDIGPLSDTEAESQILNNTYNFPPCCDQFTICLLQAAAKLHLEFEDIPPTENDTTPKEFLNFWSTAKEKTSSSKCGRHFGHYSTVMTHTLSTFM
jgi:hypothetical protein